MAPIALLVAGGTGGHLFPALALREALIARGWRVHIATDPRVGELISGVPKENTHRIPSATISGGSPLALIGAVAKLARGTFVSLALLQRLKPAVLVGFGGYPTVPPVVAARLSSVPVIAHEQNAVLGRANRLVIRLGATLATGFHRPKGGERAARSAHVGNPVRAAVKEAARPYDLPDSDGPFRLLVFGGSQGAHAFSELVPAALAELLPKQRQRATIVQQARPEDLQATRDAFRELGVGAIVEPFFSDMGERLAAAHLVICRAGASTVAELSALGRPAILVPYPHALDHDQAENARALAEAGGGWLMQQKDLTAAILARRIATLMSAPEELQQAAEAAGAEGRPDAAEHLADLVERTAGRGS